MDSLGSLRSPKHRTTSNKPFLSGSTTQHGSISRGNRSSSPWLTSSVQPGLYVTVSLFPPCLFFYPLPTFRLLNLPPMYEDFLSLRVSNGWLTSSTSASEPAIATYFLFRHAYHRQRAIHVAG